MRLKLTTLTLMISSGGLVMVISFSSELLNAPWLHCEDPPAAKFEINGQETKFIWRSLIPIHQKIEIGAVKCKKNLLYQSNCDVPHHPAQSYSSLFSHFAPEESTNELTLPG